MLAGLRSASASKLAFTIHNLFYTICRCQILVSTYSMTKITQSRKALAALGRRLRRARLERNDSMAVLAQRLGVSEQTVRAMERGLPSVQIGTWLDALWVLDELEPLDRLLEKRESLLDLARRKESTPQRQRASRRSQ